MKWPKIKKLKITLPKIQLGKKWFMKNLASLVIGATLVTAGCLILLLKSDSSDKKDVPKQNQLTEAPTNKPVATYSEKIIQCGDEIEPGSVYKFYYKYADTVHFFPTSPGEMRVRCWDDQNHSFELVAQMTDNGAYYDKEENATTDRPQGYYMVKIMGNVPKDMKMFYTNKKQ